VTAWGEEGKVSVALEGEETHHLPHIKSTGEIVDGEAMVPDDGVNPKPKPDDGDGDEWPDEGGDDDW
jgi:hypothetical protein